MQQLIAINAFLARTASAALQNLPAPKAIARRLGPGLITGAADDDPSGIATYSQAGAQAGYGLVWSLLFTTAIASAVVPLGSVGGEMVTSGGLALE